MKPIRIIYKNLPNTLAIPEDLQNLSAEIIIWPLEFQSKELNKKKRPFGLAKDFFQVQEVFFEPLPSNILSDFGVA